VVLLEAVVLMVEMALMAFPLALAVRMEVGQAVAYWDLLLQMAALALFVSSTPATLGASPQLAQETCNA
jgi:hypothetical protein